MPFVSESYAVSGDEIRLQDPAHEATLIINKDYYETSIGILGLYDCIKKPILTLGDNEISISCHGLKDVVGTYPSMSMTIDVSRLNGVFSANMDNPLDFSHYWDYRAKGKCKAAKKLF